MKEDNMLVERGCNCSREVTFYPEVPKGFEVKTTECPICGNTQAYMLVKKTETEESK